MIRLHIFPDALKGTPNPSQFCVKLEAVFRLAGVPYEICPEMNPATGPKGKLPFIEFEGERVGDSALILDYLKEKIGLDLDDGLTSSERALSHMIERLVEERLYWVIVHSRWIDNWTQTKAAIFGNTLFFPLSYFIPNAARKSIRRALVGHGLGRHTREEIYQFGARDLAALSVLLGDKPFFFGETPRLADVTVYSALVNIIGPDICSPLRDTALSHENLVGHTERMGEIFAARRPRTRLVLTRAA
jgi:glutathione S-transferase